MGIFREVKTTVYCDICGGYVMGWKSTGRGVSKNSAAYFARQEGCTTGKKVVCKKCRINRSIEKCKLQKKIVIPNKHGESTCLGFKKPFIDEHIEQCKKCMACTSFDWEKELYKKSIDGKMGKRRYRHE